MKNKLIVITSSILLILILTIYYAYTFNTSSISNEYAYNTSSSKEINLFLKYKKNLQQEDERNNIYSLQEKTILLNNLLLSISSTSLKDRAFLEYRDRYINILKNIDINIYGIQCSYDSTCGESNGESLNRSNYKLYTFIMQKGFNLVWDNNSFYLSENPEFFLKTFYKELSPMWINFFKFRLKEQQEGFTTSDKLIIDPEELRSRIIYWENFLKTNPEFPEKQEVKIRIYKYLNAYLFGTDGTQIFDTKTGAINNSNISSYNAFLKNNKQSDYFPLISLYYKELKRNNFKYSQDTYNSINLIMRNTKIKQTISDINNHYLNDNGYVINF